MTGKFWSDLCRPDSGNEAAGEERRQHQSAARVLLDCGGTSSSAGLLTGGIALSANSSFAQKARPSPPCSLGRAEEGSQAVPPHRPACEPMSCALPSPAFLALKIIRMASPLLHHVPLLPSKPYCRSDSKTQTHTSWTDFCFVFGFLK